MSLNNVITTILNLISAMEGLLSKDHVISPWRLQGYRSGHT